jgi:hypothetical protein
VANSTGASTSTSPTVGSGGGAVTICNEISDAKIAKLREDFADALSEKFTDALRDVHGDLGVRLAVIEGEMKAIIALRGVPGPKGQRGEKGDRGAQGKAGPPGR